MAHPSASLGRESCLPHKHLRTSVLGHCSKNVADTKMHETLVSLSQLSVPCSRHRVPRRPRLKAPMVPSCSEKYRYVINIIANVASVGTKYGIPWLVVIFQRNVLLATSHFA